MDIRETIASTKSQLILIYCEYQNYYGGVGGGGGGAAFQRINI